VPGLPVGVLDLPRPAPGVEERRFVEIPPLNLEPVPAVPGLPFN